MLGFIKIKNACSSGGTIKQMHMPDTDWEEMFAISVSD